MVWGGSLNKKGTKYIKKISEAEKVIKFLENFKNELNAKQKEKVTATIEIMVDFFSKLTESKEYE